MAPSASVSEVRLISFRVDGLFGEFTHEIPLRVEDRITAVIAPNGTGKTACLKLISSLFRRHWNTLASTIFTEVLYRFSHGIDIEVRRGQPESEEENPSLLVVLKYPDGRRSAPWIPRAQELQRGRTANMERYFHFVTRTGPNRWTHDHTGKIYTFDELMDTFGERLPSNIRQGFYAEEPADLKTIIDSIDCHLIETQRLLILSDEESRYDRRPISSLTISQKAHTLQQVISTSLTQYASLSQSLDRSFPRRVINLSKYGTAVTLRAQLSELDKQRSQLMEAGILDTESHEQVALPKDQDITDAIARVLTIYAGDTKEKLDSLSTLLAKIQVFRQLVGERFAPKTIEIDRKVGFRVRNRSGQIVPLEKLSSGEQHQLVLFFELLFELKANALILIDEPELSLHVAWQKKFISDLQKIISLNKFDVVLATHSPQLIGRWEELVVDLGDVDGDEID